MNEQSKENNPFDITMAFKLAEEQGLNGLQAMCFANGYNWALQKTEAKQMQERINELEKHLRQTVFYMNLKKRDLTGFGISVLIDAKSALEK
jgi:hypothetical protein